MSDCIFCKIAEGEIPAELVYEDELVVGFRDLSPVAPKHILLIPRTHIATLNDIGPGDEAIMGRLHSAAQKVAEKEGLAENGFRTVMNCNADGGQTVFHIHMHLLGGRQMTWPPG